MIRFILLLATVVTAADVSGLRRQAEVKINAKFAGAPFEGDIRPSVWALSFSPDGQYLAVGVQFVRTKSSEFPSYVLVVSADKPNEVLQRFPLARHPAMRNVSQLAWSADSKFLGVTPYGEDWLRVAVVDLAANQTHIIPNSNGSGWCDGVGALLPGPQVVERCSGSTTTTLRFLRVDGTATQEEWTLPGMAVLLGTSPDGKMLALDFFGARGTGANDHQHGIAVLTFEGRKVVRRWSVPDAVSYRGTFWRSGTAFCAVPDPNEVSLIHEIVCRDIATGQVISKTTFPQGPIFHIGVAGEWLVSQRTDSIRVPFQLFATPYLLTRDAGYLSDLLTGQVIARWRIGSQWVLPEADASFESAVSPSGEMVAIGGSGVFRVYRVNR